VLTVTEKSFALKFAEVLKRVGLKPRWREWLRVWFWGSRLCTAYYYRVSAVCDQEMVDFLEVLPLIWKGKEKLAYLEGLYDSEGYYNEKEDMLVFTNKSPLLLERVETLLREFGIESHTYNYPPHVPQVHVCRKKDVETFKSLVKTLKVR